MGKGTIPSNINNVVDAITKSGLAFANRYEVFFTVPNGFGVSDRDTLQYLSIRCDSISIPGRSFSTTPYRFYGPARNMPYEPIYAGELTASIVLSGDMRERKFFEDWMDLICSSSNYKFNYYDDYISDFEISVLTKDEINTYTVFVEEAYPKAIGDIQVGYDKDNEYLKQDVTFAFRKYTPQQTGYPKPKERKPPTTARELAIENALTSEKYGMINGQVYQTGYAYQPGTLGNGIQFVKFDPQTAEPVFKNQRGFKSNAVR